MPWMKLPPGSSVGVREAVTRIMLRFGRFSPRPLNVPLLVLSGAMTICRKRRGFLW